MFKKSPLKSSKLQKKKRKILFFKIGSISTALIIFVTAASLLSHLDIFEIKTITVEGNSSVDAEQVQEIAKAHVAGKYYYLFSRANRFLYSKDVIIEDLYTQFKRIKIVSLNVNKSNLLITIEEREPAYTWCSGMPGNTQNKCYFIDSNGYIFSESPVFSGNVFFAFYGDVDNENPIGLTYLNASAFKDIDTLITFLNDKKLHPFAFRSHDNGVYDLYLEQGGKIIFKEGLDIPLLISNLDLIIKNTQVFKSTGTSKLEYIDFRFGNKLYYKFSGDNALELENQPDV